MVRPRRRGCQVDVRGRGRVVEATRNLRSLEWAKAELVSDSAQVLRSLVEGDEEEALLGLADTVMVAYLLARRLGMPYQRVSQRVRMRVEELIASNHEIEQWYGDLSALARHLGALEAEEGGQRRPWPVLPPSAGSRPQDEARNSTP